VATLLVGYDLHRPRANYEALEAKLRNLGAWWHHLDSTWFVRTEMTPVQLRDELKTLIDEKDQLLVIDVSGRAAAWYGFAERGSQWMKQWL